MTVTNSVTAQQSEFSKVKVFEHQLDDVMELIDTTELKTKLKEVEEEYKQNQTEVNKARLGIIYHETALNLSFLSKTFCLKYTFIHFAFHSNKQVIQKFIHIDE